MNAFIWGNWMMFLLVALHIFYSFVTDWVQVRHFGHCISQAIFKPLKGGWRDSGDKGALSSFQTLCVSIGGCIGSGNVVGVATAIVSG
ncbi:MAG: alanine:cation symporter family protein, partial [Rikenellaceae bacterium]|nr:alanine:cation symporter family protein [Rikenellaceae bacterium]